MREDPDRDAHVDRIDDWLLHRCRGRVVQRTGDRGDLVYPTCPTLAGVGPTSICAIIIRVPRRELREAIAHPYFRRLDPHSVRRLVLALVHLARDKFCGHRDHYRPWMRPDRGAASDSTLVAVRVRERFECPVRVSCKRIASGTLGARMDNRLDGLPFIMTTAGNWPVPDANRGIYRTGYLVLRR